MSASPVYLLRQQIVDHVDDNFILQAKKFRDAFRDPWFDDTHLNNAEVHLHNSLPVFFDHQWTRSEEGQ